MKARKKNNIDTSLEILFQPKFDLIKSIFFDVIKQQAGKGFLVSFQSIIDQAVQCRRQDGRVSFDVLYNMMCRFTNKKRQFIIKSLNLFFQLSNLLEDQYRIEVNERRYFETDENDLIKSFVMYVKQQKLSLDDVFSSLKDINVALVWTAHPTDTTRLSKIAIFQDIIFSLSLLNKPMITSYEKQSIKHQLQRSMVLLWQSDDVRYERVDVLSEVRRHLYYMEHSLFDCVPKLYKTILFHTQSVYRHKLVSVSCPTFLTFNLWSGGDRDGNPFVTADVTQHSLCLFRQMLLRQYSDRIGLLIQSLSNSILQMPVSKQFKQQLNADQKCYPEFFAKRSHKNQFEWYRKKLDFMAYKLRNTQKKCAKFIDYIESQKMIVMSKESVEFYQEAPCYDFMEEFLSELMIIKQSLEKNNGAAVVFGCLEDLIIQFNTFEQTVLDLRQHSAVHRSALVEYFKVLDFDVSTPLLFTAALLKELLKTRLMGIYPFIDEMSSESRELYYSLEIVKHPYIVMSKQVVRSYIISMTTCKEDILIFLLLAKESGLIKVRQGRVCDALIDVVPLFELKDALLDSVDIMDQLFSDVFYRSYLAQRGHIQEVMLGYSDSNKDVGSFCSAVLISETQSKLLRCAKKYGVKLRFFHGRGGTVSRGGGPLNKAIRSLPKDTLGRLKLTEQGEMISTNYTNRGVAFRHLEQVSMAVLTRFFQDKYALYTPFVLKKSSQKVLQEMMLVSQQKYECLIKDSILFSTFFHAVTPVDLIEYSLIGSRPSKRVQKERLKQSITDIYRAIPWVFSWMQPRLLLSGFYGAGTALQHAEQTVGIDLLRQWYCEWPFFTTYIQNLEMVLLKADMSIAKEYMILSDDRECAMSIFETIYEEYMNSIEYVLMITSQDTLMSRSPKIRDRVFRRNPFVDPLNMIQIQLIQLWRHKRSQVKESDLIFQLQETVNGIAAGIRNYG